MFTENQQQDARLPEKQYLLHEVDPLWDLPPITKIMHLENKENIEKKMKIRPVNSTIPGLTTIIMLIYSCDFFPRYRVTVYMVWLLYPVPFSYHQSHFEHFCTLFKCS